MNGESWFVIRRTGCPSLFSGMMLALMISLLLLAIPAGAQTAYFSYAQFAAGGGFSNPLGVAVDAAGNAYVADTGNNAVKEIPVGCVSSTCVKSLGGGFNQPGGVAVDGTGNVYVADTNDSAVKEIPAGCISSTCVKSLGHGFSYPAGVAVDGSGNVYVADTLNNAVKEIVAAGGFVTVNTVGSGFSYPEGVAVDSRGDIFIADSGNNAVKEIVVGFEWPFTITIGNGFSRPSGVAVDWSGNVYVADSWNDAVKEVVDRIYDPTMITLNGGLSYPSGVGMDGSGNVFIADSGNNRVMKLETHGVDFGTVPIGQTSVATSLLVTFDRSGAITNPVALTQGAAGLDFAVAGAGGGTCKAGTYSAGASCTVNATFAPKVAGLRIGAVALKDGSGNSLATAYLHGVGSGPQVGFLPGRQTSLGGGFNGQGGVAVDGNGNVFVADRKNKAVKEIPPGCGSSACVKSLGSGFNAPIDVALDGVGNVFVADAGNNAVYEILAAGGYNKVKTLVSGFDSPTGVAVDGGGNVFVSGFSTTFSCCIYPQPVYQGWVCEIPSGGTWCNALAPDYRGFPALGAVAVDGVGNVFIASDKLYEIFAAGGYRGVGKFDIGGVSGVAVDGRGNLLVSDNKGLQEIMRTAPFGTITLASGAVGRIAVDGSGNVITNAVAKLDFADAPSLSFGSISVGANNAEQTATLRNVGNAPLLLPAPAAGSNPSISQYFALDTSAATACPVVKPSFPAKSLAPGASCTLSIAFDPTVLGNVSGSVVLKDNALNAAAPNYATQTTSLQGTGVGRAQTITLTNPGPLTYGLAPITLKGSASSGLPVSYTVISGPAKVSGDTLTINGAGGVTIKATQGGDAGNSAAAPVSLTIMVNKAVLTVTANSGLRPYGAANPALTYTIKGYKNGDTSLVLAGAASLTTAATAESGAGAALITFSAKSLTAWNYRFSYISGALTISKAVLTVTANNAARLQGIPNQAFSYRITGFVNGDTSAVISGTVLLQTATPTTVTTAVGTYPIAFSTKGLAAANYSFTYVNGALTILSALPSIATLSQSSATVGGPGFTLTITGANFTSSAVVKWGATTSTTTLATVYFNAGRLTALVPKNLIVTRGTARVTVTTAKGTSAPATFTIR